MPPTAFQALSGKRECRGAAQNASGPVGQAIGVRYQRRSSATALSSGVRSGDNPFVSGISL
jgi:hypothetical protein